MSESRTWLGGLPVAGSRELTPLEREELRARRRDLVQQTLLGMVSVAVILTMTVLASTVITASPISGFLLVGVVKGFVSLLQHNRITTPRRLRALSADIANGVVSVCGADCSVEVLPLSRLVFRVNGVASQRAEILTEVKTATVPARAAAAAQFVRPFTDSVSLGQRALTIEEQMELAAVAPRPDVAWYILPAVALIGVAITFARALAGQTGTLVVPIAFAVIAVWSARSLWKQWRPWRRFAADVGAGYVLILRLTTDEGLSEPEEYLPFSHVCWTAAGQPAFWRRVTERRAKTR